LVRGTVNGKHWSSCHSCNSPNTRTRKQRRTAMVSYRTHHSKCRPKFFLCDWIYQLRSEEWGPANISMIKFLVPWNSNHWFQIAEIPAELPDSEGCLD
jgi:hypothetical protein